MNDLRTAAQQALEALENNAGEMRVEGAISILETALAQQDEPVEPVAGVVLNEEGRAALVEHGREEWHCVARNARRLYTAPPQRKPLTEEEIMHIGMTHQSLRQVVRAVERAHGIKEN